MTGRARVVLRFFAGASAIAAYIGTLWGVHLGPLQVRGLIAHGVVTHGHAVDVTKAVIAVVAAFAVLYERDARRRQTRIDERWKRLVGVVLAVAAIVSYFNAFKLGYSKFYHRWDQYHYYVGAKYFRELGYDGLYRCALVAQDEIGTVQWADAEHIGTGSFRVDMSEEVRRKEKTIRNLGGDNLIMPAAELLESPEACKDRFSEERWKEYKRDITFFRIASGQKYWEDMQRDHGYNPPPVWTIAGWAFASIAPAGKVFSWPIVGAFNWAQALSMLDLAYGAAMFAALWWAFGWRVCVVSAILWGTQSAATSYWTQGAFLRQDWLFWLVFSVCLLRKRWFALSGAALAYAALLRVFPGLVAIGWLAVAGSQLYRHQTLAKPLRRALAGGAVAVALLVPLSLVIAGPDSYQAFYRHTLQVHDRTPLTNHMGLRVLVSQKVPFGIPVLDVGIGPSSGRMKYTRDNKLTDPFEVWKRMRNERYDRWRPLAWGFVAFALAFFAWVVRRTKSLWMAACLAQIFMILMAQLTCYYYSFLILLAPLSWARRRLEVPIFGFAALSQVVFFAFEYNDDKYWMLTAISLALSSAAIVLFMRRDDREKVARLFSFRAASARGAS